MVQDLALAFSWSAPACNCAWADNSCNGGGLPDRYMWQAQVDMPTYATRADACLPAYTQAHAKDLRTIWATVGQMRAQVLRSKLSSSGRLSRRCKPPETRLPLAREAVEGGVVGTASRGFGGGILVGGNQHPPPNKPVESFPVDQGHGNIGRGDAPRLKVAAYPESASLVLGSIPVCACDWVCRRTLPHGWRGQTNRQTILRGWWSRMVPYVLNRCRLRRRWLADPHARPWLRLRSGG